MRVNSLLNKIKKIKEKEFIEPAGTVTTSEEYHEIKTFMLAFTEERYPDAHLALLSEFDQIEAEDRAPEKQKGLQLKREKSKKETKEWKLGIIKSRLCWYGVMGRYPDASIAMAEEIRRLALEHQG